MKPLGHDPNLVTKLLWVGLETISWIYLLPSHGNLTNLLSSIVFYVITCTDTINVGLKIKLQKMSQATWLPGLPDSQQKITAWSKKIKVFSQKFIIWLAKVSQFEGCLKKHETQIYKIMKTNSRYKSHVRSHSIKIRFKQTYVNLNFIRSLKCQIHYINSCFSVYTYRYFWLLGSGHNYWPYLGHSSKRLRKTKFDASFTKVDC